MLSTLNCEIKQGDTNTDPHLSYLVQPNLHGKPQRLPSLKVLWRRIFSFLNFPPVERCQLCRLCCLFRDALPKPIVIDVGSFFIKAGYANGPPFLPSVVIPTPGNGIFGDRKVKPLFDRKGFANKGAFESGAMVDIWRSVFERLGTTPEKHNSSGAGVLLCTSVNVRETFSPTAMAMFDKIGIRKLYMSCRCALILHAHGLAEGIAVNCGRSAINIDSVVAGDMLQDHTGCKKSALIEYGAMNIIERIGGSFKLPLHHACDFVKQHCFVPLKFGANFPGNKVLFPARESKSFTFIPKRFNFETTMLDPIVVEESDHRRSDLWHHSETLFQNIYTGQMDEGLCGNIILIIQDMTNPSHMDAANKETKETAAPPKIDCNIVLSGGLCKLTGVKERLEQELEVFYPRGRTLEVKVLRSERPEYDVWKGGALLALSLSDDEWYQRTTYEEYGPEPLLSRGRACLRPRGEIRNK